MTDKFIAPYITMAEYRCPCGECPGLPPDFDSDMRPMAYRTLFNLFRRIREEWGRAIPISSGYRCIDHNLDIGGDLDSVHLFGLALDLDLSTVEEVSRLAVLINHLYPELRIGVYKDKGTWIHIDVGYTITPRLSRDWHREARWYG